jgi:hypothetical protein
MERRHALEVLETVGRQILYGIFRNSWKADIAWYLQKQLESRHFMVSSETVGKQTLHGFFRNSWKADIGTLDGTSIRD